MAFRKTYVEVTARIDVDGRLTPLEIVWRDGRIFAIDRMQELYKNIRVTGEILLNGENVLQMHPMEERRRIGMVFQLG